MVNQGGPRSCNLGLEVWGHPMLTVRLPSRDITYTNRISQVPESSYLGR
jgi:hypothetical protein